MTMNTISPKRKPLYESVANNLRQTILANRTIVRLPTEAELCAQHVVSRITVRKALDILAAEGVIERTPGRGTFVRRGEMPKVADVRGLVVAINVTDLPGTLNFVALQVLGAGEFLEQHGAHVCMKRNPHTAEDVEAFIVDCGRNHIGGLLAYAHDDVSVRVLVDGAARAGVPAVAMNTRLDDRSVDYVTCDNVLGGRLSAEYLLNLGHRKAAFVTPFNDVSLRDRWAGFSRRFEEGGGKASCFARWTECLDPAQDFLKVAEEFTAVQCGLDKFAAELVKQLLSRHIRVPEDISVIGYDNCVAYCEHAAVPITTVAQPAEEMGRRAAQLLWERLAGLAPAEPRRVLMTPSLVIRGSTAVPRRLG